MVSANRGTMHRRGDALQGAFGSRASVGLDTDRNLTDFMVGARYTFRFSPAWALTLRGDGGFGDTNTNYDASVLGSYRTHGGAWLFGYRHPRAITHGHEIRVVAEGEELA
jgi:hypothetical protein